jgi:NAD(P)-dependent dehydrogenase (short-subunit alcohol dehydrogenase family)
MSQIIMTGYLAVELSTLHAYPPYWMAEQWMYTTTAIAPVLIIKELVNRKVFTRSTTPNIVLVTSCACSIAHGGGHYAGSARKAALNMVGKLLSMDLKPHGVIVSVVHPGCLHGPNQSWDGGHGVTPDQAAVSLIEWMEDLTMEHSGQFWAPMGRRDVGSTKLLLLEGEIDGPRQLPYWH